MGAFKQVIEQQNKCGGNNNGLARGIIIKESFF